MLITEKTHDRRDKDLSAWRGKFPARLCPTVKISTKGALASKKDNWIDYDASDFDADRLLETVLKIASGEKKCRSENNYEIAFFKKGVTL